jgi:hypothetical protein
LKLRPWCYGARSGASRRRRVAPPKALIYAAPEAGSIDFAEALHLDLIASVSAFT